MILALSFLSFAQAEPTKGFRSSFCVGVSSSCPFVQFGASYVNNRFAIDIGGFPYPLGAHLGLRYFLSDAERNTRLFVGASAGFSINGFYDISATGLQFGADFHIFEDRKTIITPKIGVDYTNSSGLITTINSSFRPSLGLGVSRAY